MNLTLIIPAILFAAIGIAIIVYVFRVLISALVGNPWAWLERQRLTKKARLLAQAITFEKENLLDQALASLRSAFFLEPVKHQGSFVDIVSNHNMNVLARLVSISDRRGVHIANLPIVEGLLASRHELMRNYFDTTETVRNLRTRQKGKSKAPTSTPDWALAEFSKKVSEIKAKIDANRKAIEDQFLKLFASFTETSSTTEITYH